MFNNGKEARVLFDTETIGANLISETFVTTHGIPCTLMKEPTKILRAMKGLLSQSHEECTVDLSVGELQIKGNKMLVGNLAKNDRLMGISFLKQQEAIIGSGGLATSAKNYCASGALPLRQDTRWANLAPLTLGAPDAVLPLSLTPGTSGGMVAIQTYLWTLVATQPYIPCFRTQLTTPSSLLIHYSFIQPPEPHWSITRCGFPAIPLDWKGGTLGTNDWLSEKATVCFILILRSG